MVFTKTEPNIMPRQSAAAAPVAPTPQMEMPLARPVIAAPQPQQQPTVQPDAVPQPAAPQQPAVQAPQMQMPTGQPYMSKAPAIQPAAPVNAVPQNVTPQAQAPIVPPTDEELYTAYRQTLPDNLRYTKDADYEDGGDYRSRRYWELHGKPKDFNEGLSRNMFTKEDDGLYHSTSVAYNKDKDEYEFMKAPNHPTIKEELKWYYGNEDGAPEFRKNYELDDSGKYYKYVKRGQGLPVYTSEEPQEPNQEPLQTKALEQANPGYWQKYGGINWNANGGDFFSNLSEANIPIQDAIKYYDAFQKDNGGKELDPWDVWARLGDKDFTKSKKQQDEEDKKLERQQKWEKIGNVFNHLANLWGTMRGAPGMQLESGEALTKRQQEQVDRVKTLRQAAGKRYLDALQQKRAEEFKRKQLENEAARLAENQRRNDLMDAYRQEELARRKKADEEAAKAKAAETARKTKEGEERNERAKERNKAAQTSANASASRANTGRQKYEDSKNSREKIIEEKQGRKKIVYKEKEVNPGRPKKRKLGLY